MSESIYNLIPRVEPEPEKAPMHRSKYPPSVPPTGSTFGRTIKSHAPVTNLAGDYDLPDAKSMAATWGPSDSQRANPTGFTRKHQKEPNLPEPSKFDYNDRRKAPIPSKDELPPPAKATSKNFVVDNAVYAMTLQPKKSAEQSSYLEKEDYGSVPLYLQTIKAQVEAEKEQIRLAMEGERAEEAKNKGNMRILPDNEKAELLASLQKKWNEVNRQYQGMTHMTALDTLTKIKRKEEYEAQLAELEKSIERLSKKVVFVKDD